jgi:uncharacterized repeat protein (TIGR02543 family)
MWNKSESIVSPLTVRIAALVLTILLLRLGSPGRTSAQTGALIFVTSLEDKISSTGGCSLEEAIYAANLNSNMVPDSLEDNGSEHLTSTQCVPGSADGTDIIVLPAGAVFLLDHPILDIHNPFGPTGTPPVTSSIRIVANGSTLRHSGTKNFRAFAVTSTGDLTISQASIVGFAARGGDGKLGAGGGMGGGGAIYVKGSGSLTIEGSTFSGNGAIGGNGSHYEAGFAGGGGGGGMGGSGFGDGFLADGGGGGGSGGDAQFRFGGGTIPRPNSFSRELYAAVSCGGISGTGLNGGNGLCPGGGGAGGEHTDSDHACLPIIGAPAGKGGKGNYGGGGGGGGSCEDGSGAAGGDGGFGGGGGAGAAANSDSCDTGGTSEFGGGGGACTGHPGSGGKFGGGAIGANGGGGGGLGGAIFSDGGTVKIRNSTFNANYAVRGVGGENGTANAADNGADAGGAIYSWNGTLDIRNSTITGNQGTGSLAGVAVSGANFSLFNTLISNNGAQECGIGTGSTINGAGNLIQTNVDCPGVVSSDDPQLGPLQDNTGTTPTMAIASTSPAIDAADPNTSLNADQRGIERPQPLGGGFDIGAYERCTLRKFGPTFTERCENDIISTRPDTWALKMVSSPAAGGILTPAAGDYTEPRNVVVLISATPNPGFVFNGWSGNITNSSLSITTVVMDQDQTITANFIHCACAADVTGSVSVARAGFVLNPVTKRYAQNVTVTNVSAIAISTPISLVLDSLSGNATLFNATGITDAQMPPAGSPYLNANITLGPGQSTTFALQFTDSTNAAITYTTRVLAGPGAR